MGGVLPQLTACAAAVAIGAGDKRIHLFAYGRHTGRDGRGPYELRDLAHAQAVIEATRKQQGSTDIVIDYDHQTVFAVSAEVGGTAEAAGWIDPAKLVADDQGIWAVDPEWTDTASEKLGSRKYRYLSPYFGHRKDGLITRIINAALVNRPNLELAAVAAELPGETNDMSELIKIAAALGLAATASADDIVKSIGGLKTAKDTLTATASALGLTAEASSEELTTAAASLKTRADAGPDTKDFVPVAQYQPLVDKVARMDEERATAAVDAGIKAGKLAPATRDHWLKEFRRDETAFASYLAVAPVILPPGEQLAGRSAPNGEVSLTSEERAMCSQFGWNEDEYLAQKKEEMGA